MRNSDNPSHGFDKCCKISREHACSCKTSIQYYIHLSFTLSESQGIDSRNHPKFESGRSREAGLILCITERGLSKGQTKKTCQIELQ